MTDDPPEGARMTLAEAYAELGLAVGAPESDARRAYTRLLKARKPETDPDGFMRLRAAWDVVRGAADAPVKVERPIVPDWPEPVKGCDAYAAAWERAASRPTSALPDSVGELLQILVDLLATGRGAEARRLGDAGRRAVEARGTLAQELPPRMLAQWEQAIALAEVAEALPRLVLTAFVHGIVEGDWEPAGELLAEFQAANPAEDLDGVFKGKARRLLAAAKAARRIPRARVEARVPPARWRVWDVATVVGVAAVLIWRIVRPLWAPDPWEVASTQVITARASPAPEAAERALEATLAARHEACAHQFDAQKASLCTELDAVVAGLHAGRCEAWLGLRPRVAALAESEGGGTEYAWMHVQVDRACLSPGEGEGR